MDNARRRAWQQRLFAGSQSDVENTGEALPQCTVTVLPARDEVHVVFGAPVSLQATREIHDLASRVARWPAVSAVDVVDFGDNSAALVEQLASRGITADTRPPEFESIVLLRSSGQWFLDVEHASGARAEVPFGRDVAGLVTAVRRLHVGERPVEVAAKRARRAEVTPSLDAYGIRWRADKAYDSDSFEGERATSAGMSMRMSIKNYGWMSLRWAVGDDKHKLALTVNNDGWNQLARATRLAVCDEQPVYSRTGWVRGARLRRSFLSRHAR